MKNTVLILFGLLVALKANAFYRSYAEDLSKVQSVIEQSTATRAEKDQALQEVAPALEGIRAQVFKHVLKYCSAEADKYCSKFETDEDKVKCLSEKQLMLSSKCLQGIRGSYR